MSTDFGIVEGKVEVHGSDMFEPTTYKTAKLHVTRFFGGKNRGKCIQLTIDDERCNPAYIQLTREGIDELKKLLERFDE